MKNNKFYGNKKILKKDKKGEKKERLTLLCGGDDGVCCR
jgi:hypothetical protein